MSAAVPDFLFTRLGASGELVAEHLDPTGEPDQVLVGIETERGPWVQALLAAGYVVYPVNPMQVARYRERHSTSGAKSDPGDAHLLAEILRLDRGHHRPIAGDSEIAVQVKISARAHQTMIWSRVRQVNALPLSLLAGSTRRGETRQRGGIDELPSVAGMDPISKRRIYRHRVVPAGSKLARRLSGSVLGCSSACRRCRGTLRAVQPVASLANRETRKDGTTGR